MNKLIYVCTFLIVFSRGYAEDEDNKYINRYLPKDSLVRKRCDACCESRWSMFFYINSWSACYAINDLFRLCMKDEEKLKDAVKELLKGMPKEQQEEEYKKIILAMQIAFNDKEKQEQSFRSVIRDGGDIDDHMKKYPF